MEESSLAGTSVGTSLACRRPDHHRYHKSSFGRQHNRIIGTPRRLWEATMLDFSSARRRRANPIYMACIGTTIEHFESQYVPLRTAQKHANERSHDQNGDWGRRVGCVRSSSSSFICCSISPPLGRAGERQLHQNRSRPRGWRSRNPSILPSQRNDGPAACRRAYEQPQQLHATSEQSTFMLLAEHSAFGISPERRFPYNHSRSRCERRSRSVGIEEVRELL
jgi:hypothetical protein